MSEILTQPFVSPVTAFDATNAHNFTVNVLGGAAVAGFSYEIIAAESGQRVTSGSINITGDVSDGSLRSYLIPLSANTLSNGSSYRIRAFATPQDSTVSNSPWSQYAFFDCYVAPVLSIKTSEGGSLVDLADNTQLDTDQLPIVLSVNEDDTEGVFSYGRVRLKGVNGSAETVVWESERLYAAQTLETVIEGFERTNTADAPFESYTVEAVGYTTENMKITHTVKGVTCVFEQTYDAETLILTNVCAEGLIRIQCAIPETENAVSIAVQRRAVGETLWITLQTFSSVPANIEMDDRYAAAGVTYEYRVVLYNGVSAPIAIYAGEILSTFYDTYICDATTSYKLTNAWSVASAKRNRPSAVYEPYGAKYPTVAYNAVTNYDSATTSAILLAPESTVSARLNPYKQTALMRAFNQWATNGEAKILKDFNGGIWVVAITDAIQTAYSTELANALGTTSFDWVEIGDFTQASLTALGLLNKFELVTSKLSTPKNVAVMGSTASWDKVTNATRYGMVINNDDWGDYAP